MTHDRLQTLIDEHFSGAMDAAERQELDALLVRDEAARKAFLQASQVHVQLFLALNRDTVIAADNGQEAEIPSRRSRQLLPPGGLAAPRRAARATRLPKFVQEFVWQPLSLVLLAAATISGTLLAWQLSQTPSRPIAGNIAPPPADKTLPPVARLARTVHATWGHAGATLPAAGAARMTDGMSLAGGDRLMLRSGLAEIVFDTGATLILEGPAEFVVGKSEFRSDPRPPTSDLDTRNCGFLTAGKLVATVPAGAKGFTVHTPAARVVDLGTEFGVVVKKLSAENDPTPTAFSTEVQVFQGRVTLEPQVATTATVAQTSAPRPIELRAGESAICSPGIESRVNQATESVFVRKLPVSVGPVASITWPRDSSLAPGDIVVMTSDDLKLVKINPETGAQSLLATGQRKLHGTWTSLGIDRRGKVLVGAFNLPKAGLGVLRMDPHDGSMAVLGNGAIGAAAAGSISSLADDAAGFIYAVFHGQGADEIVKIDPLSGTASKVTSLEDTCAIDVDRNGRDLLVIGGRTGMIGLLHAKTLTPWIAVQPISPCSIAVGGDGRVFVGGNYLDRRMIWEVSRDTPHTVTSLATLPGSERPGGRWNIAVEPDGNIVASPWQHDSRVFRLDVASGKVSVVTAGGLLGGEAILTVVPKFNSQQP